MARIPVAVDFRARPIEVLWLAAPVSLPSRLTTANVRRLAARHAEELTVARYDSVASLRADATATQPTALIFHTSRCGSTLATRMLAATNSRVVVDEPEIINTTLGERGAISTEERLALVDLFLRAMGGLHDEVVIKLTSWNTLFLTELAALSPTSLLLYLYRHPLEVLPSLCARPPRWLNVDCGEEVMARLPQLSDHEPAQTDEVLATRFLHANLRAALREPRLRTLSYERLPDALWTEVAEWLGGSSDEAEAMRQASRWNAKRPSSLFVPDGAAKRSGASDVQRRLASAWLTPSYVALEERGRG